MKFNVTIHKQTTSVVEVEAADGDAAIAEALAGRSTVLAMRTISAQFLPQEVPEQA